MSTPIRVCVIGAGAGGLCAARHLSDPKHHGRFLPTVFEQTPHVGGTWVYTDAVGEDKHGNPVHSSMYKHLKTNLPKEVMAFPDFPFPKSKESFLPHAEVRSYLEDYSRSFGLERFIRYETAVRKVSPLVPDQPSSNWLVVSQDLKSSESTEDMFDAVVVCNGHYSVPSYGEIKDIERFDGLVMHSHNYRTPEPFKDKVVVVFGAAASGIDISQEIATTARQVYLSHNNPLNKSPMPGNLAQVRGVVSCLSPNGFLLADGSKVQADALLYCTGYKYSFPFLSTDCNIEVDGRIVKPLYKHMINTAHPSMMFVGIPLQICPFPQFDLQVRLFVKVLTGEVRLPSAEAMDEDTKEEFESKVKRGMAERHFHKMGKLQWAYNDELAHIAATEPIPKNVERLYDHVHNERQTRLMKYKEDRFELVDEAGDGFRRIV